MCNGPGAIYECGCSDIPEGDCDCDSSVLDALGVCGGDCLLMLMRTAFVMTLTTVLALMTIVECNGPGAIYECGCSDIPEETGLYGNVLDAQAYVAETVLLMLMRTAFVMTLTTVLALMTIVSVRSGAIYECGCSISQRRL